VGVVSLLTSPLNPKKSGIHYSKTFLPTYGVGIFAWLLHGFEIGSFALITTCIVQLAALIILIRKTVHTATA